MQVDVLNSKGEKTGRTIELPEDIFNIEPNDHVIYLAVKQYLAAQRQGTAKVKTRAQVKGASRKLHKQKGTGGSRKGNIRNPLYKGGGIIHGPQPRDYGFKLNRKVKDLAKMSALAYKARESKIVVVEDIELETPKTKTLAAMLQTLTANARRTMLITAENTSNIYLSSRNIPNNKTVAATDINTYDIVNASMLVFTEGAAKLFAENTVETEAA